ncbi:MAG: hypothetical protein AAFP97_06035 [Pseudomonadota bacterium]
MSARKKAKKATPVNRIQELKAKNSSLNEFLSYVDDIDVSNIKDSIIPAPYGRTFSPESEKKFRILQGQSSFQS